MFWAGHGNDPLDDVYELSILEYLLDVHLGADVLLGVLVAGAGAVAGAASTTTAATTATATAMTSRVFIMLVGGTR